MENIKDKIIQAYMNCLGQGIVDKEEVTNKVLEEVGNTKRNQIFVNRFLFKQTPKDLTEEEKEQLLEDLIDKKRRI